MSQKEMIRSALVETLRDAQAVPHVDEAPPAWPFVYKMERGMTQVGFLRPGIEEYLAEKKGLTRKRVRLILVQMDDVDLDSLTRIGAHARYAWLRLHGKEKELIKQAQEES